MDFSYFKEICGYRQKRLTGNNFIREDTEIDYDLVSTSYDQQGNMNMTKCFQYNIYIPLLDTLPNGKSELRVYYEIISSIPHNQDETQPHPTPTSEVSVIGKYPRLPEGSGLYLGTFKIN